MSSRQGLICVAAALVMAATTLGYAQKTTTDPNLMAIGKSGQVLRTHSTMAIFWGGDWNNSAVAGDIITGLDTFFDGFGNSGLAQVLTEYYDRNGAISPSSTYLGHVVDASTPPSGVLSSSQVIAQACAVTNDSPDPNGVYFVYTSTAAALQGTCAIRSWGTCGRRGPAIQVVYTPYMTGEDAGCRGVFDSGDDGSVTGHSTALGQYGNVTGTQLMNAIADPRGAGWKDANGHGISFKCDGIFPPAFWEFSNGSLWTIRAKWSNAAYRAGTGLPNLRGLPGCVF